MRYVWGGLGFLAIALAVIGTVLPIMPTVPFLIVAAFAFARSSPRFHRRLMNHRIFGPQIRQWQDHHAIERRVKVIAIASMAGGLCVSYFLLPPELWLVQCGVLALVSVFIASRPAPPPGA